MIIFNGFWTPIKTCCRYWTNFVAEGNQMFSTIFFNRLEMDGVIYVVNPLFLFSVSVKDCLMLPKSLKKSQRKQEQLSRAADEELAEISLEQQVFERLVPGDGRYFWTFRSSWSTVSTMRVIRRSRCRPIWCWWERCVTIVYLYNIAVVPAVCFYLFYIFSLFSSSSFNVHNITK